MVTKLLRRVVPEPLRPPVRSTMLFLILPLRRHVRRIWRRQRKRILRSYKLLKRKVLRKRSRKSSHPRAGELSKSSVACPPEQVYEPIYFQTSSSTSLHNFAKPVTTAKNAAIEFLISQRDQLGWWRDFDEGAGSSDEWVTAYVSSMLAATNDDCSIQAAHGSWKLLKWRRWWLPGWGYNGLFPPDADSTLWALQLAAHVGDKGSVRVRRALRFLSRHVRSSGGLTTFAEDGPIRRSTRLGATAGEGSQNSFSFAGWCGPHLCITALAASLPSFEGRAKAMDYIRRAQHANGSWTGYWWCDPEYPTALAIEALSTSAEKEDRARIERAVTWAVRRVAYYSEERIIRPTTLEEEHAFAAAWAARILLHTQENDRVQAALKTVVARLLAQQCADGSWAPSAKQRIPPPDVTDPEAYPNWRFNVRGNGSIKIDHNRCFTTATVLGALHRAEKQLG